MKISQILDKLDANQLFIPAFQREYVWKRENAKDLISSLIREYPTGTMLTWETNSPPELKGNWQYNPLQWSVKIILDGQQRITTLYMLIRGSIPPYYKESEILQDPRNLYINISTLDLQYYKQTLMQNDPYWVNITDIFTREVREMDLINNIRDKGALTREDEDRISSNFRAVDNIPGLEFLEQTIPVRASLKEAIDIFYIVNASGINLTEAELALAQISGYWPNARETFKVKLESLKAQGFNFNLDFIIFCLLGIIHNMWSDFKKLHDRENEVRLREVWEQLDTKILDYVINILKTHAYIDHSHEINSVYALIPIIVYAYNKNGKLNETEIKKIIKWFYYSQIKQRYIAWLQQKLDKDIGIVNKSENPFDELLNNISLERNLEIYPDDFEGVDIRNALYSLMRWYFKSKNATCLTTGVWIRTNMWAKYSLEWDHIFPYSVLKANGYNMNNRFKYALAQEITNRAILTQVANRSKSNKLAEDYLKEVKSKFPNALALQSIPDDENLWKLERFEDFLKARRIMLANELNAFLKNITTTEISKAEISIEEMIDDGENSEVEFKSSLRWSYQANQIDKKLEWVILKTVAAFSNAEGWTLVIWVDDEWTVLWLKMDYISLGNGTKDKFELHLRNLINDAFWKVFATSYCAIKFHTINELEICEITILKYNTPLYLEIESNGQKVEKFYVRSGNSSQEIGLSEISEYLNQRFK